MNSVGEALGTISHTKIGTRDTLKRMNPVRGVIDFLLQVKVELQKVVWPSPNLTVKLTLIVIIVTVIVGFFIGGIDFLLTKLLSVILNK